MNGTGDQPDDLDVSIRWPQNNTPEAASPPGRRKPGGRRSPPAPVVAAKPDTDRPPPERVPPPAAPPIWDGGGILSPSAVSPQAVDLALAERIDDLGGALETVTDQISGLSEQTSALRTLMDDRLRPTRAVAASGLVRSGGAGRLEGTDGAATEILDVLAGSEAHLRRIEQVISALSVEVAEVGQILSDEAKAVAETTNEQLRAGFALLGTDVETLAETFADSLAEVGDQLARLNDPETPAPAPAPAPAAHVAAAAEPAGPGAAGALAVTAEAVSRIEALVEDLLSATENRPTDVSELTASTLQRLGLTVSSKIEATATTAAEAIDSAVDEAIDRAVRQFKEIAPPVVDRSTTAAVTRLEERIASLTQQRDEHDRETKATLNGLEETIARLASAQAEDLERVLDVLENPATSAAGTGDPGLTRGEDRLARVEVAVESLRGLPKATEDLADLVAKQFVAFTAQMDVLRRRLTVRSSQSAPLSEEALAHLADLITRRMAPEPSPPTHGPPGAMRVATTSDASDQQVPAKPATTRAPRAKQGGSDAATATPRKAARPLKAASSKRRPSD